MPKQVYICTNCGKDVVRYPCHVKNPNAIFCNRFCKNEWEKRTGANNGSNNNNYGKKWTEEQRRKAGNIISKRYDDPNYRYNIGKSNRGKKLPRELVERMHGCRTSEDYSHSHSEESKKLIGIKSKAKFNDPEYILRVRKKMEELGYWVPLSQKKVVELYYKDSNWISNMFNLIEDPDQLQLLSTHGVFSHKNSKGVVRDHIYSRKSGFTFSVFPEILRHPCNCQLLTHGDNVRKAFGNGRYRDSDRQTLEELFEKIEHYKNNWIEQELCLTLIRRYKEGLRWENGYVTFENCHEMEAVR